MISGMTVMMSLLAAMLGADDAAAIDRFARAAEVFQCNFDASWDRDFTGWPEGWTRQRGAGFPFYLKIKIGNDAPPTGGRCLDIQLDGGAAAVFSPPKPIEETFDYVAEAWVKTVGLKHDEAMLSLVVMDERRQPIERFFSESITQTGPWRKLRLGPIRITSGAARLASIGLHVQPKQSRDLTGKVSFGDVWIGRIPQTRFETSDRLNFFTDPRKVELRVSVSGQFEQLPTVVIRLEDALGHCLDETEETPAMKPVDRDASAGEASSGTVRWSPRVEDSGFYRAFATIRQGDTVCDRRQLTLAVVEPALPNIGSEFGLSVPVAAAPMKYEDLLRVASQSGIGWLKLPLWIDTADGDHAAQQTVAFCQQIRERGIEPVGVLSHPPRALLEKLGAAQPTAADLFTRDAETWYPSLEPTLVRLAAQVGFWQLGRDDDFSLVDHPRLNEVVAKVKTALDRIGQDTRIGLSWTPGNPPEPIAEDPPWRFLSFLTRAGDEPQQLAAAARRRAASPVERWVMIEPASRKTLPTAQRAADLVQRMAAAKVAGANAIFCTNPFDDATGLMRPDGTPDELFLPWRTAALCLGGAEYLGSAVLPHGSKNYVFLRENDAVMLVWNDQPTTEPLSLGGAAQQIDLWGRRTQPVTLKDRQAVHVEPMPCFVVGISKPVARWMLSLNLLNREVSTSMGTPQSDAITVKNPFAEKVTGRITIAAPDGWEALPSSFDFELAAHAQRELPFRLVLPFNAQSGSQQIRLDCSLQADGQYEMSVYRNVIVGCPDLKVRVASELNTRGELEVTQQLVNTGAASANFRCDLFLPGRARMTATAVNLGRNEDTKVYRVPQGASLLGKTLWLHIEEIDGPRVVNHRFIADE